MPSMYRKAAIDAQAQTPLGRIILIQPLSYRLFSTAAIACAAIVIAFFLFGAYTKHNTVSGQLMPDAGLIRVYSPRAGMILERHVTEGQKVQVGDVLFVVGERPIGDNTPSLQRLIGNAALASVEHEPALFSKTAEIRRQLDIIDEQIETQRQRIRLSREAVEAYSGLLVKSYIPKGQLRQKEEQLLDQKALLQQLKRERTALTHQLGDQFVVITAARSGVATAVNADLGQNIQGQRPLVSIVPDNSHLYAHLYAPSRAVGFIRAGDEVALRFQAFPFQKFGHLQGAVAWVSKAAIDPSDIAIPASALQSREPLYEIHVRLEKQTMTAYGKQHDLQTGMTVDAEIRQERRKLYEWVLDPLYTLSGRGDADA